MKNRSRLFRNTKLVLALYSLLGIALFYLQDKLLFHPQALAQDYPFRFALPFHETMLDMDAGTHINIVQFTVADSARKGIVLYFHGNRENVNHYAGHAIDFVKQGYEVWMPDYPTFGKSTGTLTEQGLYDMALQVYKMARVKYQPADILLYGKSMGTGIAAELASVRDCRRLILETPYYSVTSLTRLLFWMYPLNQLMHFKMRTQEYLPHVTAPVSIFHGTADGVIPYFNAQRLKQVLKKEDEFITIEGGSHNDLTHFPLMQHKLDSLLHQTGSLHKN